MFGWFKILRKKFGHLHPLIQFLILILLFIVIRWTWRTVSYSNYTGRYLEGFGNNSTLTYFHMDGCGHCKRFSPEWETFASNYNGPLKLRKVEAKEMSSREKELGIQGFPTVMVIDSNGRKEADYDGERTAAALNAFAS